MEHGKVFWAAALGRLSFIYKMGEGVKGVVAAIDIPRDWNPRAKQQPTGLIAYAVADAPSPPCSSPTGHPHNRKRPASICSRVFLVGCPVGLEPTVSRSTIWRVNRLRYGHHIMRPKGLEPPAHCLEGSCSIHLSYGRTLLSHWVLIWFAAVSRSTLREV